MGPGSWGKESGVGSDMEQLVIVRPFGPWRIGDVVTDKTTIDEVLGGEHGDQVVRVQLPEEH